jgi:ABC-type transport system involved in multi-copper enzyme maturation permease subunit
MNPFIKKEIRLLLPSWLAVLSLAALLPWLAGKDPDASFAWMPLFVFFGMVLLAVDSFGREFSLGTFSALMSQPMERRQIWWTKITILVFAAALIFIVFFINSGLVFHRALNHRTLEITTWGLNPKILGTDFRSGMFGSFAAVLIALAGGLWTTLLIRQAAAAFWITFLAPLGLLMLVIFFLPAKFPESLIDPLLYGLAGIYVVAGCWFAYRLFHRAQDAAWTGGVISFSTWRYFEGSAKTAVSTRQWKPVSALLKKEFQLHSISLLCAGALLALHIVVISMRAFYGQTLNDPSHRNSLMAALSEFFWTFWLAMPLVIGCMAVAEERKLGVMDGQFCQPVSRRLQFIIKYIPALLMGVFLGGILPVLLETAAARLGVPGDAFKGNGHGDFMSALLEVYLAMISLSAGLALVGIFASSLAKNFLQALSIAIVSVVLAFFFFTFLNEPHHSQTNGGIIQFGAGIWGSLLPALIGLPVILILIPWLTYRNFSHFTESRRLWRRNLLGFAGALVFVFGISTLIYQRTWEWFEPFEAAHGPARFSLSNPPEVQAAYSGVKVRLPDGRLWLDCYYDEVLDGSLSPWKEFWYEWFGSQQPKSHGPAQFLVGSNWISAAPPVRVEIGKPKIASYLDEVAIQSNGTLWISSEAPPGGWGGSAMTQFGDETNWQQVTRLGGAFILLKNDGTLWQWGFQSPVSLGDTNWPSVRHSELRHIGSDADWKRLFTIDYGINLAQKTNDTIWRLGFINNKTNLVETTQMTNVFDSATNNHFAWLGDDRVAYVNTNGTLWVCNRQMQTHGNDWAWVGSGFLQIGQETNWTAVAVTSLQLVALKADGSLWQWPFADTGTAGLPQMQPTRMGIHNDWVSLNGLWSGTLALSADGGLWYWPSSGGYQKGFGYEGGLLRNPWRPKLIANVFNSKN